MLFDNIRELISLHKKPIHIFIWVAIAIGIISWILSYKIVVFQVSDTKDITVSGYSLNSISSNVAKPVELSPGFNIVSKNINYFEIEQADKAQIIAETPVPFYSIYQAYEVKLQTQKQLVKTYTGPHNCFTGNQSSILSYSCSRPSYVYNYVTNKNPWRNEAKAEVQGQRSLVPYKDGLLGIRSISGLRYDEPLIYTNAVTGKVTTYKLPSQFSPLEVSTANLIPSQTNDDIVLFASSQSDAFYVLNIATNTVVKKVNFPESHSKEDGLSCQVAGNQATCFIGKSLESIDKEVDYNREAKKSTIYTFELSVSDKLTEQPVDSNLYLQAIHLSASGQLFAITDSGLLVKIDQSGKAVVVARNVQSVIVADKLYFSRGSELYVLDEASLVSNLAFETTGNISGVKNFHGELFVSMLAVDSRGKTMPNTYTFKLSESDGTNNKSWSILELSKNKYVSSVDFNGDKIFIRSLPVSDQQGRQQIKASVEADLQKLPVDASKYDIIYAF